MFFCVIVLVSGCRLCLVRYFFVISTDVIDCLLRLLSEMTCCGVGVKPYELTNFGMVWDLSHCHVFLV